MLRQTLWLFAIVLLALCASARAQDSGLSEILKRGVLRVGATGDYSPFASLDRATGVYSGLDIDLAQSLADALGVKLEIVATSWPSLTRDFEAGNFDMAIGGVSVTLERAKHGLFSTAYLREGKTPIARCADSPKFQTLADIDRPGVRVIVNPGGTNEKFDRARLKAATIITHRDNATIFDALAAGDADIMITDASETRYQQKLHLGVLCAIHPDRPFDFAEKAYWLPFDPPLKAFVDQWLHLQMETGAFAAFAAKWLP